MTVTLRPTLDADLAFVMELERRAENTPYVGQWSRGEHADVVARADRQHWIIESEGVACGFVILYDLRGEDCGVYVKRIVVTPHDRGLGRAALERVIASAESYVWLNVRRSNERARHLYRSMGFVPFEPTSAIPRHRAAVGRTTPPRNLMLIKRAGEKSA